MRFMLLLKGDPGADARPSDELIGAMQKYGEELHKAGVLLAGEGLEPSGASGARVIYSGGSRKVVDGPFAESKELVAGYYLLQVSSREEAIEWASRCPVEFAVQGDEEAVVEVRRIAEFDDQDAIGEARRAVPEEAR
ncbi:YciI family protein [Pseudonocardia alaniniphila]|uniref:YciI family protein n=1 Tax=Pseudonocardia alaniniphila TaxID=75291 RepID=A0ABS9THR0_9PSEU|nr:YciI family protein [Pseudonocardia alaniniphila]MCH6167826.1 YciI family protein [Pseudonocardia alaniniphila]